MTARRAVHPAVRAVLTALALPALLFGSACERRPRRAGGNGPYAERVAETIPKIEKSTGLRFKTPPRVETRSKGEVRQFLERMFAESRGAKDLEVKSAVYKRLGLLPDTLDARKLYVDLLSEQIVGFYDPKTKVLYVVDGAPPEETGVVVSHELVHALQDQYFDLDSLQQVEGDDDRVFAAQAVMEGQATYEQLATVLGDGNVAERLPGGWDRIRQSIREQQSSMPVFAGAPMLIQETLIFPYLSGAEFIRRFKARRPGQVVYSDMPTSSEQILHESAYFGATRDRPLRLTLPAPTGASVVYENGLGEFETRLFLFQQLGDQNAAIRGAAGWGGDRYALVDTPKGRGLVWVSVWDTPVDAAEFRELLVQAESRRYGVRQSDSTAGAEGARTLQVAGRRVTVSAGEVQGRPAVVLVDAPAGANVDLDLRRVTVR